jgi:hypothetical protein
MKEEELIVQWGAGKRSKLYFSVKQLGFLSETTWIFNTTSGYYSQKL